MDQILVGFLHISLFANQNHKLLRLSVNFMSLDLEIQKCIAHMIIMNAMSTGCQTKQLHLNQLHHKP